MHISSAAMKKRNSRPNLLCSNRSTCNFNCSINSSVNSCSSSSILSTNSSTCRSSSSRHGRSISRRGIRMSSSRRRSLCALVFYPSCFILCCCLLICSFLSPSPPLVIGPSLCTALGVPTNSATHPSVSAVTHSSPSSLLRKLTGSASVQSYSAAAFSSNGHNPSSLHPLTAYTTTAYGQSLQQHLLKQTSTSTHINSTYPSSSLSPQSLLHTSLSADRTDGAETDMGRHDRSPLQKLFSIDRSLQSVDDDEDRRRAEQTRRSHTSSTEEELHKTQSLGGGGGDGGRYVSHDSSLSDIPESILRLYPLYTQRQWDTFLLRVFSPPPSVLAMAGVSNNPYFPTSIQSSSYPSSVVTDILSLYRRSNNNNNDNKNNINNNKNTNKMEENLAFDKVGDTGRSLPIVESVGMLPSKLSSSTPSDITKLTVASAEFVETYFRDTSLSFVSRLAELATPQTPMSTHSNRHPHNLSSLSRTRASPTSNFLGQNKQTTAQETEDMQWSNQGQQQQHPRSDHHHLEEPIPLQQPQPPRVIVIYNPTPRMIRHSLSNLLTSAFIALQLAPIDISTSEHMSRKVKAIERLRGVYLQSLHVEVVDVPSPFSVLEFLVLLCLSPYVEAAYPETIVSVPEVVGVVHDSTDIPTQQEGRWREEGWMTNASSESDPEEGRTRETGKDHAGGGTTVTKAQRGEGRGGEYEKANVVGSGRSGVGYVRRQDGTEDTVDNKVDGLIHEKETQETIQLDGDDDNHIVSDDDVGGNKRQSEHNDKLGAHELIPTDVEWMLQGPSLEVPNDSLYQTQWYLRDFNKYSVKAESAWALYHDQLSKLSQRESSLSPPPLLTSPRRQMMASHTQQLPNTTNASNITNTGNVTNTSNITNAGNITNASNISNVTTTSNIDGNILLSERSGEGWYPGNIVGFGSGGAAAASVLAASLGGVSTIVQDNSNNKNNNTHNITTIHPDMYGLHIADTSDDTVKIEYTKDTPTNPLDHISDNNPLEGMMVRHLPRPATVLANYRSSLTDIPFPLSTFLSPLPAANSFFTHYRQTPSRQGGGKERPRGPVGRGGDGGREEGEGVQRGSTEGGEHVGAQTRSVGGRGGDTRVGEARGGGVGGLGGVAGLGGVGGVGSIGSGVGNDMWQALMQGDDKVDMIGGGEIIVAVLDTSCDYNHPDLRDKIWFNYAEGDCHDGIDGDGNGYVDDCYGWDFIDNKPLSPDTEGHGTASAGLIGASSNNEFGLSGLCWNCKLLCIRALTTDRSKRTSSAHVMMAIDYAIRNGAKISNNSWGSRGIIPELLVAIARARQFGHLFVAAAGNAGGNNDDMARAFFPASHLLDNVVSVGSIDFRGQKASFSNYGQRTVDLFAPGTALATTEPGKGFTMKSGTSYSSPLVTATAAMIMSLYPYITFRELKDILIDSVTKVDGLKEYSRAGGTLNAFEAVKMAIDFCSDKDRCDIHSKAAIVESWTSMCRQPLLCALPAIDWETFWSWMLAVPNAALGENTIATITDSAVTHTADVIGMQQDTSVDTLHAGVKDFVGDIVPRIQKRVF
eukprot:GHVQ01007951.1.p1 GENE.GHVQ01007951.1~~GHVQ01007951.1.p1  ORF type:complete len:1538 (+),score=360.96 GHVQ01007951.1:339-4952(+)